MQEQNIQRRALPVWASNIGIEAEVKVNQKDKKDREGHVRLIFFDNKAKFTVAEVMISRLTAMEFKKMLEEMLKKINSTMKKKNLPKKKELKSDEKPAYMG